MLYMCEIIYTPNLVADHNHFTAEFVGSAHRYKTKIDKRPTEILKITVSILHWTHQIFTLLHRLCNLEYSDSFDVPVFYHNGTVIIRVMKYF